MHTHMKQQHHYSTLNPFTEESWAHLLGNMASFIASFYFGDKENVQSTLDVFSRKLNILLTSYHNELIS